MDEVKDERKMYRLLFNGYKFSDLKKKWNLDLSFPLKYYLDIANEGKIKTEIQAQTYGKIK